MGYKEDLLQNLVAIKRAKYLVDNNLLPTDQDIEIINSFTSWGNFKELLYPHNLEWQFLTSSKIVLARESATKEFTKGLEEIFPEDFTRIYENIKISIPTSFYTEAKIVKAIFDRIEESSVINSFLDPCVGGGIFIDEFIRRYPTVPKANIYALDIDSISTLLIKAKYPEITVINEGFEKFKSPIKFDLISSNIPFANDPVFDSEITFANATIRVHNYFLYKTNSLLSDGGILQLITTGGLINTRSNKEVLGEVSKSLTPTLIVPLTVDAFKGTEVNAYYIEGIKDGNPNKIKLDNISKTEDGIWINTVVKRDDFPLVVYKNPYGKPEYAVNTNNVSTIEYLSRQTKIYFQSSFSGKERVAEFYIQNELFGKIAKDNFNNKYLINKGDENEIWLTGKEFKESINVFYNQLLRASTIKKENVKIVSSNTGFVDYFNTTYFEKYAKEIKLIIQSQAININDSQFSSDNIMQGELVKIDGNFYNLKDNAFIKVEEFDQNQYDSYFTLKEFYKKFLNNPEDQLNRQNLLQNYIYFKEKNYEENIFEIDSFALFINSLEDSDIFKTQEPESKLNAKESLYKLLNEQDVFNLEEIQKYCELSKAEILNDLSDLIIFNPLLQKYQQKDYFLSGNLYQLVENIESLDGNYAEIIAEIKANFPERIHFPEIKLQFGTRWIDVKHIADFVNKKYNIEFSINYNSETDFFVVQPNGYSEIYRNETFPTLGNRYIYPQDIVLNAFYHTYPIITYSVVENGERVTYTDKEATELLKRKIDVLRDEFTGYMNLLPCKFQ